MKYRVRLDLSFEGEAEARSLVTYAKSLMGKAVSIKEGGVSEEVSFCDMEICRHDERLPCTRLERFEIRNKEVVSS